MVNITLQFISFTAVLAVLFPLAAAISPGSFFIQNVALSTKRVFSGLQAGVELPQGFAVTTTIPGNLVTTPPDTNEIFTIDSTMTELIHEETGFFVVVDASDGGSPNVGVILSPSLNPVPPFNAIGNSAWSFVQGTEGIIVQLEGRNLAWALMSPGFGTQITLQPLNGADLRQQWTFVAHGLV